MYSKMCLLFIFSCPLVFGHKVCRRGTAMTSEEYGQYIEHKAKDLMYHIAAAEKKPCENAAAFTRLKAQYTVAFANARNQGERDKWRSKLALCNKRFRMMSAIQAGKPHKKESIMSRLKKTQAALGSWRSLRDTYPVKSCHFDFYSERIRETNEKLADLETQFRFCMEIDEVLKRSYINSEDYEQLQNRAITLFGDRADEVIANIPLFYKVAMRSVVEAPLLHRRSVLNTEILEISTKTRDLEQCKLLREKHVALRDTFFPPHALPGHKQTEVSEYEAQDFEISLIDREIWFLENNLEALVAAQAVDTDVKRIGFTRTLRERLQSHNALEMIVQREHTREEERDAYLEVLSTYSVGEYDAYLTYIIRSDLEKRREEIKAANYDEITYYQKIIPVLRLLVQTFDEDSQEGRNAKKEMLLSEAMQKYALLKNKITAAAGSSLTDGEPERRIALLNELLKRAEHIHETYGETIPTDWIEPQLERYEQLRERMQNARRRQAILDVLKNTEELDSQIRLIRELITLLSGAEHLEWTKKLNDLYFKRLRSAKEQ